MKQIKVNPSNEPFYSKEFVRGFNLGAQRQYEADIADMPTWIPCSERLPQLGQKVLAGTKRTVFTQVFKGYYSKPIYWKWEHNNVKTIEAWMPLPEPWKGKDND